MSKKAVKITLALVFVFALAFSYSMSFEYATAAEEDCACIGSCICHSSWEGHWVPPTKFPPQAGYCDVFWCSDCNWPYPDPCN